MNKAAHFYSEKAREIIIPGARFFPEDVTATSDGTSFVGSLFKGLSAGTISSAIRYDAIPVVQLWL